MSIFDKIELSDEVLTLVDELEQVSTERELSREERALIDVVDTVNLIEDGEGLNEFWLSPLNHRRIINSFDILGASQLVDGLNASQWCQAACDDRSQYSDKEEEYLAEIEEEFFEGLSELPDILDDFIEDELG